MKERESEASQKGIFFVGIIDISRAIYIIYYIDILALSFVCIIDISG